MSVRCHHRRLYLTFILLLVGGFLASLYLLPNAAHSAQLDPVTAAWEKARVAGSYHFTSDITQVTVPSATVANVGRSSRTENHYLEGEIDLHNDRLAMSLWSQGGSVLQNASGLEVRVENGKTWARQPGAAWQEIDNVTDGFAPQGDFLAYLSAIRNISAHAPEQINGVAYTRYSFQIDGPAFARYAHKQMVKSMQSRGELPPGITLEVPTYYQEMSGTGELWVREDGLPLRQILDLQFPDRQSETVHAQITVNFSQFGTPPVSPGELLRTGNIQGFVTTLPAILQSAANLSGQLLVLISLLIILAVILRYRRRRALQTALASTVITSMLVGPLLTTLLITGFLDTQTARAAVQEERQNKQELADNLRSLATAPAFNPHANPLESTNLAPAESADSSAFAAPLTFQPAAAALSEDNGDDSDGDGLSDFVEERIGTLPDQADTDLDGLDDGVEVNGFSYNGRQWYLDPNAVDSNGDGLGDALEWGFNADGSRRTTPLDTDGDNLPDLYDDDNDNDGVPDRKDLAAFGKSAVTFGESDAFELTVNNLQADRPTYVEFQLRPQNPAQLWYAFNVLDWPQDSQGQMRDMDNGTYADYAAANGRSAGANESNGDMKLVPMLEIRMPEISANLPPTATQTITDISGQAITRTVYPALEPFNITINDYTADGATKIAYVPLSLVTDETTGERVAFSGQMLYQASGSWDAAHSVRLVWVVQALNDLPTTKCDDTANPPITTDCTADGYRHNVPRMIHAYYADWNLTGLTVREEQGATMAIAYGDPTLGTDATRDDAVNALAYVLDNAFVVGRDHDNNGQRDLTVNTVHERFDHTRNGSYSEQQRYAVPNLLRVTQSSYTSVDEAVGATAIGDTGQILAGYNDALTDDPSLKPLLLFVHENTSRLLTLDTDGIDGGYVAQAGTSLVLDMNPDGQPEQAARVMAGIKLMAYCPTSGATPTWNPCPLDTYWGTLEQRHPNVLLDGETDPVLAAGRLFAAQLYYTSLSSGTVGLVQEGSRIVSGFYSLPNDSLIEANVRYGLQIVGDGAPLLADAGFQLMLDVSEESEEVMELLGRAKVIERGLRIADGPSALRSNLSASLSDINAQIRKIKINAAFGAIGAGVIVFTQFLTFIPDLPVEASGTFYAISTLTNIGLNVVKPIVSLVNEINSGATTAAKALTQVAAASSTMRIVSVVGVAITVGVAWGIFFYTWAESGLSAGDPALNQAFVETVATTLVIIYLTILALTPVGAIIGAILAAIDFILTVVCELGVDELRTVPGMGGACWTITNQVIKGLSYFLYNYDVMVDTDHKNAAGNSDMTITGAPAIALADRTKGFAAGNPINVTLPVTTTIVHKDPDPANGLYINAYLWLFSPENLRSSTFNYSLSRPDTETPTATLGEMSDTWDPVEEDHTYGLTPMYRGQTSYRLSLPNGADLQPGLNRTLDFHLNTGYAIPAYECWGVIIPWAPLYPIPVCYSRETTGNTSNEITTLKYDIFPATLDEFITLGEKVNGLGLAWDSRFTALADADGDGLLGAGQAGLDPDDSMWDTDGDGLSDRAEVQLRANGTAISPVLRDTDNDGLTDWQEMRIGSDPAVADSDNDGLSDGEEVRHIVYDASGAPTSELAGGWEVRINAATPFNIWVSSNPNSADSDGDGISDAAERQLALSTCSATQIANGECEGDPPKPKDNENRPYHPLVTNTPPLSVFVATDDRDGFVSPGQSFRYTTTVVANTPVVPGTLSVTAPASVGGSPHPYALSFNDGLTETLSSAFAVAGIAASGVMTLESTANTRLPDEGPAVWSWQPLSRENLPVVLDNGQNMLRDTAFAVARSDRQDSYLFNAHTINPDSIPNTIPIDTLGHFRGDVLVNTIPGGIARQLDADTDNLNTAYTAAEKDGKFLRGVTDPSVACNDSGQCMVVWEHLDFCNTVTIHSLKVVTAGEDGGSSGIEPVVYLVREPGDSNPSDGGYQLIWSPDLDNGTIDMESGDVRGPDGGGFPRDYEFCGPTALALAELDGHADYGADPALTDWSLMSFLDVANAQLLYPTLRNVVSPITKLKYTGDGHKVDLTVSINTPPSGRQPLIAAALLAQDGTISKSQFQVSPTPTTIGADMYYNPVVVSDGENFLVAWENLALDGNGALSSEINAQLYDEAGNATNTTQTGIDKVSLDTSNASDLLTSGFHSYADLTATWATDQYIVTRLMYPHNNVTFASPNTITSRAFGADGNYVANSTATRVSDANPLALFGRMFGDHHLAWDPVHGNALLVYQDTNGSIQGLLFGSTNSGPVELANSGFNSQAAYHPGSQSWIVSYLVSGSLMQFRNLTYDLSSSLAGATPQFPEDVSTFDNSLACPAANSAATVDLRFEELPDATSFADASGRGNSAGCIGGDCPAAGYAGAPDAPLSDYAIHFDGINDHLNINHAQPNSFSVAYWIKTTDTNGNAIVVDQGANVAGGWALGLNNGQPDFQIGTGENMTSNSSIGDGNWHFVVATRNHTTGAVALYVDGNPNPVASDTFSTAALNAVGTIRIGSDRQGARDLSGILDHVQIFPVALSGATIQALYNRTLQSYCAAGGISADRSQIHWTRLEIAQEDTRGGRINVANSLNLTIDADAPTAQITSVGNNAVVPSGFVIAGTADDASSGVAVVEVSINNGAWVPAAGVNTWSFSLSGHSGNISVRARAVDRVGNAGAPSPAVNLTIDDTAPEVTIDPPAGTVKPSAISGNSNQWQVTLSGTVIDNISGHIEPTSVRVLLEQESGLGLVQTQQVATLDGSNWTINYLLDTGNSAVTGSYRATVQARDKVGNEAVPAGTIVHLDNSAPFVALSANDTARDTITQTITISGTIGDTNSSVGIDSLEVALTPVEQIAALPAESTSDAADAQLNRSWTPVTLAQRGAGVAESTWSFTIPAGLENHYQLDLRSRDMLGNQSIYANQWRGVIDTSDPRVVMEATYLGVSYYDDASNQQRYQVRFVCGVADRYLDESAFTCPGEGLAEPVRSFEDDPALQNLFPDWTIRSGLALSYTLWTTTTTPPATTSGCDLYGRCVQASTPAAATVQSANVQSIPAPDAPMAMIVNPADGSVVAANDAVSVTVVAEAGASLQAVTISLDNAVVQTLTFAQTDAVTRTLRTVNVPIATEGVHTLVAEATDWNNTTQATLYPVSFTLDQHAPNLTIDGDALTLADTWMPESGMLRFNGAAGDSMGLAAVQLREGENPFFDATFDNGLWRAALPVQDPEGRTLDITVRAIDLAGRVTELNHQIATDLSAADAPDTSIDSGPVDPSDANSAEFVFGGSLSAVAFDCRLDEGNYVPCVSPVLYDDLSKGSHTFRVRAIDSRGLTDLSPALYTWTVNASQPDATITDKPDNPTTERDGSFTFAGDVTAVGFECSLAPRGFPAAFSSCTSPYGYTGLANGTHVFQVRAIDNSGKAGAADRYVWTVLNAAPVAHDQSVVVIPNQAEGLTLSATDSDPLRYTVVTPPGHGALLGLPPNLTYVPDTDFGGVDSFTFRAGDGLVESNLATVTLFVDDTPPVVTCSANPNRLWSPNHELVDIQATVTVTDLHSGPAGFTLVTVTSSQEDSGLDPDDVSNDIQDFDIDTPDTTGKLRAERDGTGEGRIYTLTYRGLDMAGNAALCSTIVFVPHSQNQPNPEVKSSDIESAQNSENEARSEPVTNEGVDEAGTGEDDPDQTPQSHSLFLPLLEGNAADTAREAQTAQNDQIAPSATYLPMLIR